MKLMFLQLRPKALLEKIRTVSNLLGGLVIVALVLARMLKALATRTQTSSSTRVKVVVVENGRQYAVLSTKPKAVLLKQTL